MSYVTELDKVAKSESLLAVVAPPPETTYHQQEAEAFSSLVSLGEPLSPVLITAPAAGHTLRYDGAKWVNTNLLTVSAVGAGAYITVVGDSGVADRGGLLLNNTTTPVRHLKLTATFTGAPGTSSRFRLGWVADSDKETFLNGGAAIEVGPTNNILLDQGGVATVLVRADPGGSEVVRVGGNMRLGNTSTSIIASAITIAHTAASSANIQQIAGGRIDHAWYDSAAGVDEKYWALSIDGAGGTQSFSFLTRSDAGVAGTQWLKAVRLGNATTFIEFGGVLQLATPGGVASLVPITAANIVLGSVTLPFADIHIQDDVRVYVSGTLIGRLNAATNIFSVVAEGASTVLDLFVNGSARWRINTSGSLLGLVSASKIVGGSTSLALRNNADSADNILVADGGAITFRDVVTTTPVVGGKGFVVAGQTQTTSQPVLDLAQTWNSGAVTFTALTMNVTDTASGASSLLLILKVGGSGKFSVDKAGNVNVIGQVTAAGFNAVPGSVYQASGTQVVSTRVTGYTAMTGTANRGTSYATSTITLVQLAERVKAIQDDLTAHGLIGA